jgi:MerR family transcriptional regulator, repressor of the yfmOP operon
MPDTRYSVDEVTQMLQVTPRTLHYYEEVGLITGVQRTEGGHRFYDKPTLERLRHILRLKNVAGVSLQEISDILAAEHNLEELRVLYRGNNSEDEKAQILDHGSDLLQKLLGTLEEKIDKLTQLRDTYKERLDNVERLKRDQSQPS